MREIHLVFSKKWPRSKKILVLYAEGKQRNCVGFCFCALQDSSSRPGRAHCRLHVNFWADELQGLGLSNDDVWLGALQLCSWGILLTFVHIKCCKDFCFRVRVNSFSAVLFFHRLLLNRQDLSPLNLLFFLFPLSSSTARAALPHVWLPKF